MLPIVRLQRSFEAAVGIPFSPGNDVQRLRNGDEIFPAMLEAIRQASETINFVTFVYWQGDIALTMARALAERARAGVTVRVLLDAYGAKPMSDECLSILEQADVRLRWFRPLSSVRIWRHDKRTHRKVLVVDNRVGFTGGVGIGEQWTGDAQNPMQWRETHFELRGASVTALNAAFFDNWCEAGDWEMPEAPSDQGAPGRALVQVLRSSATVGWTDVATLLRTAIGASSATLKITTPYFAPDSVTEGLLIQASLRGVDVKLLVPGPHCDQSLPQLAGSPGIERLLKAGVRVWEYQRSHVHAKVMTVDGVASLVGSANLNHRSLGKDEECCAVILDEVLAQRLDNDFSDDVLHSRELDAEEWARRPWFRKSKERLARLVLEQL